LRYSATHGRGRFRRRLRAAIEFESGCQKMASAEGIKRQSAPSLRCPACASRSAAI
jgi:hypothetical protein